MDNLRYNKVLCKTKVANIESIFRNRIAFVGTNVQADGSFRFTEWTAGSATNGALLRTIALVILIMLLILLLRTEWIMIAIKIMIMR